MDVTGAADISDAITTLTNSLENLLILLICIAGFAIGWKKILPGLVFYAVFSLIEYGHFAKGNIPSLIIDVVMWLGLRLIVRRKLRNKKLFPIQDPVRFET